VFETGLDVTMIGLDVTHKALLTPEHGERLAATGRVGAFVAELLAFYHRFHAEKYGWAGSPIHDAVAVAHVVDPTLVETRHRHVRVETASEARRGRTVVDLEERLGLEPNAHVGVDIDAGRFIALLLERLPTLG
jgi:purine nucleosidase/pyrimidine-specific ribonucleoside hydrolase